MMKVMLILVDGMRPDAMVQIPQAQAMMAQSASTLEAQTVYPSVTLPCHMSLFHSVDPARHGITTNLYMPQVRPIAGLCEVLKAADKSCAFFYNWEELRDLSRPGSLRHSFYASLSKYGNEKANEMVYEAALESLRTNPADFSFVYLGWVDEAGHAHGWMTEEYMHALRKSWEQIDSLAANAPEDMVIIVTADHGGHDRTHGSTMPEDMTTPIILRGPMFTPGSKIENASIKDIAPTIAALLGGKRAPEWEGKELLS